VAALKPMTRSDLDLIEVGDEAVVLDRRTGILHHLNPMAALVFQLYDGTATIKETSSELAAAAGVPAWQIEPKVRGLHRQFREAGLLEGKEQTNGSDASEAHHAHVHEHDKIRLEAPGST
jgi:Coenzyme PQQ synthesis protein D (PqqD)